MNYIVWKINDRAGDWYEISTPVSQQAAERMRAAAYAKDCECTVRVLPIGKKPWEASR